VLHQHSANRSGGVWCASAPRGLRSLQELGEHLFQFREILRAVAYQLVDDGSIDRQLLVHQDVPNADHGDPAAFQVCADATVLAEASGYVPALFDGAEALVGDDMAAHVQGRFDGQLQKALCAAVAPVLGDECDQIVAATAFEVSQVLGKLLESASCDFRPDR
jgi:hypothetical protein